MHVDMQALTQVQLVRPGDRPPLILQQYKLEVDDAGQETVTLTWVEPPAPVDWPGR